MKFSNTLIIAVFALLLAGCANNKQENTSVNQPPYMPPTTTPPVNTTAPGGVQHYICANNCEGSGGPQAGTCPVCNSQYVHNAAYHNQPGVANTTPPPGTNPMFQQGQVPPPPASNTTVPPPTIQAAQNAAGVYHYTCSNGCAGGSGTTGNCASCGAALAHNAAYHNN